MAKSRERAGQESKPEPVFAFPVSSYAATRSDLVPAAKFRYTTATQIHLYDIVLNGRVMSMGMVR